MVQSWGDGRDSATRCVFFIFTVCSVILSWLLSLQKMPLHNNILFGFGQKFILSVLTGNKCLADQSQDRWLSTAILKYCVSHRESRHTCTKFSGFSKQNRRLISVNLFSWTVAHSELSPESFQSRGFTFVQGGFT